MPEDVVLLEAGGAVPMVGEHEGEDEAEGPLPTAKCSPGSVGRLAPQWGVDIDQELHNGW